MSLTQTERLLKVVHDLRTKCPWDKKQTHKTLIPYLLEEAYETIDAIEKNERSSLREELGDVLLQVALHAEIAKEKGGFTFEDVARSITDKMIRRHPHIYQKKEVKDYKTHLQNWTKLKAKEKPKRSLLEGTPKALPALQLAHRYGEIASSVGFDWESATQVMKKVKEELCEFETEVGKKKRASKENIEMELGDLLFSITQLSRHLKIDAEAALRKANGKFEQRLTAVEKKVRRKGKELSDCSPQELESAWNTVKRGKG